MPWALAKDEDKKDRLATVLYNLVEAITIGAVSYTHLSIGLCIDRWNYAGMDWRSHSDLEQLVWRRNAFHLSDGWRYEYI